MDDSKSASFGLSPRLLSMAVLFGPLILLLTVRQLYLSLRKVNRRPLPPGPRRLPLIGNLFNMPRLGKGPYFQPWLSFGKRYGPISSLSIMGQTMIVLSDREVVQSLLNKGSKSTASRPHMEFAYSMCGFGRAVSVQKSEEGSYRQRRRLVHQYLGTPAASEKYWGLQEEYADKLLRLILTSPEKLREHLQSFTAALVLEATYGHTLQTEAEVDYIFKPIQQTVENFTAAFLPMTWVADAIPILRLLPGWLPGAGFVRTARKWRKLMDDATDRPYLFVQEQMSKGTHRPSYVSSIIERCKSSDGSSDAEMDDAMEEDIKMTAVTMYGAGLETTKFTLEAFVLAMIMYPEVQRKAQDEIDAVIGTQRLPKIEDRANLPYTANLVTEVFRWFPTLPMGLVHAATEDIVYDKYLIPKGSMIIPSVWWFCHDPEYHADPERFDPDRYLAPRHEPDPRSFVFGFGRRICPGRYFADASVFVAVARILATMNIANSNQVDAQGRVRPAEVKYSAGVLTRPMDIPFKITPRNAAHAMLARDGGVGGAANDIDVL